MLGDIASVVIDCRGLRSHSFEDIHIGNHKLDIDQLDHREELVNHSFDRTH